MMRAPCWPVAAAASLRALARHSTGAVLSEFAFCLPVLLGLGLYGAEVAHLTTVNMQVSQLALSIADNASRLGQTDNGAVTPTVTESAIDSVMEGGLRQGQSIQMEKQGRIILSSLERDEFSGRQYIHWQRCRGKLKVASRYGDETTRNGLTGSTIQGVGGARANIQAPPGSAVMVAEITYKYDSLFGKMFLAQTTLRQEATFLVRDDRNLQPGVTGGNSRSSCR